jgi:hypothetical protein
VPRSALRLELLRGTEILTKGKQVKIPAETLLSFKLDQDLQLRAVR